MNNGLIDPSGDASTVTLSDGNVVSMQVIQQVYKEVTGKVERLGQQYYTNHRTEFADLENLNAKVEQILEQYHVAQKVCTVTFFHTDDSHERFSSFDRARAYEAGSVAPI